MSSALLPLGAGFAVAAAISVLPPRRPGTLVLGAWAIAWPLGELPLHALAVEVALVTWALADGQLAAPHGALGLALAVAGAVVLLHNARQAARAAATFDAALAQALGADHPARAASVPGHRRSGLRHGALSLAAAWPWRPRSVERVANLEYHRAGRVRRRLDVLRAADPARRRAAAPVLVYVHGGGWVIGHKAQQGRVLLHHLADAGWVCVSIEYALSPRATFPEHLLDVKRALRWVRERIADYGGDPRFVVLAGGSAGAHLSALAALTPCDEEYQREFPGVDTAVQGCVALYGVYDFVDRERAFSHRAFRDLLLERIVMKRRLADAPAEFEKASPRWRVGPHAPPFLVVHGDRDCLAPLAAARHFVEALRATSRAPVAWAELPGAQHAFDLVPTTRTAALARAVERFGAALHADWRARADDRAAASNTGEV